ncbi:hypothetical protein GCM10010320_35940 [Streptomyces caelestis]|nr:hypothetical protein GCM10010320_35940 [Streptomyces caelestis]
MGCANKRKSKLVQVSASICSESEIEILRDRNPPRGHQHSPAEQEFGYASVQGGGICAGEDNLNPLVAVEDRKKVQEPGG